MLICIPISSILQFINSKINWTFFSSITSRSRNFNSIISTSVHPKKSDKQYLLFLSPPRVMQKKAHKKNWPCKIWGRVTLDGLSKNRVMLMVYPNKDPFFSILPCTLEWLRTWLALYHKSQNYMLWSKFRVQKYAILWGHLLETKCT